MPNPGSGSSDGGGGGQEERTALPCGEEQTVCLTSSNHWSWTLMEVLNGGMLHTLLSLKYLRSSAVAPITAKLAPWLKSVPLFADGGSSGRSNASAAARSRTNRIKSIDQSSIQDDVIGF